MDVPYKELVDNLIYAMVATRLDLSNAMNIINQFMSDPSRKHYIVTKRILQYLQRTHDLSLQYWGIEEGITFKGFLDSVWGGDLNFRRSTTGFVFVLPNGAVSWVSKMQPTMAISLTKVEYMATSFATEAMWLRKLLQELSFPQKDVTIIFSDNQGNLTLIKNHKQIKHIDIQDHFVRDMMNTKEISF